MQFETWYLRNRLFVLSVLWPISVFILPSSLIESASLVLNISAYVLQLSGLIITIMGLLSTRSEFGGLSPSELLKGLFRIKPVVIARGGGTLMNLEQVVLDVSPVTPTECRDLEEKVEVNTQLLFKHINNDRFSIRHLLSRQQHFENDFKNKIGKQVGEHYRTVERVHLSGSGLALVGLIWVGVGMTQAAIATFITYV